VDLPAATSAGGNPYSADVSARLGLGNELGRRLGEERLGRVLDNGGAGLAFVREDGTGAGSVKLAHEHAGALLCSHFIDPLVTAFQGMPWPVVWQCLHSRHWVKAVWDRAQALELARFGIPQVLHLPMAAPDRAYSSEPVDAARCRPVVSFVGGQNTTYFAAQNRVPTQHLLAGVLAQAVRGDLPDVSFYDIYHELYQLGEPIRGADDMETQVRKTLAYYNAKLFFNAGLCIRNRDRFVIFLQRQLGDAFELIGKHWDTMYGLPTVAPLPTSDAYFDHLRHSAININLVNGNAETGLNMRHFEITATGGFMLCYDQPELADCFEVAKECEVFRNERELLEKIRYYLAHPEERAAIAYAGQQRTLRDHLYSRRLATLLKQLDAAEPPAAAATETPSGVPAVARA